MAGALIGGVSFGDLPFTSAGLVTQTADADDFAIAPLPNHLFTRDTSAWIYAGVSDQHDGEAGAARARR